MGNRRWAITTAGDNYPTQWSSDQAAQLLNLRTYMILFMNTSFEKGIFLPKKIVSGIAPYDPVWPRIASYGPVWPHRTLFVSLCYICLLLFNSHNCCTNFVLVHSSFFMLRRSYKVSRTRSAGLSVCRSVFKTKAWCKAFKRINQIELIKWKH